MPGTSCRRATVCAVAAALIAALGASPAPAQKVRQPSATSALTTLVRQTARLPSTAASRRQKARLRRAAASARRSARRRPCTSVRQLATFRRTLRDVRIKTGRRHRRARNRLKALGPTSMAASRALLASRRTRRCGGGVRPSTLETARTRILRSDANGMRLRVTMPALRFVDAEGGGRTWTKLVLPNTGTPAAPGDPGIPMLARTLGVPEGARLRVRATDTTAYTIEGVDVFPAQREPVDGTGPGRPSRERFKTPRFVLDSAAYRKRGNQPADPADGTILGRARDLTLGALQIPAAQYDAARKRLKILNSVDVTVTFTGGSHTFDDQLESPWEQPQRRLRNALLNAAILRGDAPRFFERCGEEMLVITHPSTLEAATTFAAAKRAQGMRTSVVQTGTPAVGTTPGQIQAYIRGRLTAKGCIHPSYVTLLGDDELIPVFPGIGPIQSDLEYALRDGADEMPDVALGRILGDDAAAVMTAVTKIIAYETTPPGGAWLRKATIAAEFQDEDDGNGIDDRSFSRFAEISRRGIMNTPGAIAPTVDRIYRPYPDTADPMRHDDGTELPPALRRPAFAWNGTTGDISAAWNEGRFLMVHRGHGGTSYWDTPYFGSAEAAALTNGAELPVVLSINCYTGAFNLDENAFATRALVNPNGGAVGVFGDTEVSPSWHNTELAFGFLDALLPRVLDGEGPATKLRTGEALIHGKARLAGIWPPPDGGTRAELYLWHYFGDPSMQMWGGDPAELPDLSRFKAAYREDLIFGPPRPDPPPYGVELTVPPEFNGQAFSLLRNGEVIGKGIPAGGKAAIPAAFDSARPKPGELTIAFEADGRRPASLPVDGVPPEPPPPPPPPQQTALTISCPSAVASNTTATIGGTLTPGSAGDTVEVTYTSPGGRSGSFTRTATTNASGDWTSTFDTGPANDGQGGPNGGTWTVSARYRGSGNRQSSGPVECTFEEQGA